MYEYMKIAREYFDEFEGKDLYPDTRSWMLWLGVVLLAALIGAFIHVIQAGAHAKKWGVEMAVLAIAEIAFLVLCNKVQGNKRRMSVDRAKARYDIGSDDFDLLKRASLQRLTGVPPHQFLSVAEECSKLVKLKNEYRLASDGSAVTFGRRIYDPDSKARLLAIVLSSCAIFVALLPKADPDQGNALLAAITAPGVLQAIGSMMMLAGMFFIVWIALHQLLQSTGGFFHRWITRIWPRISGGDLAMRYLVRDLIGLHSRVVVGGAEMQPLIDARPSVIGMTSIQA